MAISILNRVKNHIKDGSGFSGKSKPAAISIIGPLSSMLGPSGRVTLASLNWYFQESSKKDFIEFVQNPVLMGSALNAEYLSAPKQVEEDATGSSDLSKRNQTVIVNSDDLISKKSGPGTSLPYAIYPLVKRPDANSPANAFMIGRAKNCDMNMKDMAISKVHAVIRIVKTDFYIQDGNSTNGTKLNGRRVADKPQILHDNDMISLGNYDFTFITPASLHELLAKSRPYN
jgi:hypothetical protein